MANAVFTRTGEIVEIEYNDKDLSITKEVINLSNGFRVQRMKDSPTVKTNLTAKTDYKARDVDSIAGVNITGTPTKKADQIYDLLKSLIS